MYVLSALQLLTSALMTRFILGLPGTIASCGSGSADSTRVSPGHERTLQHLIDILGLVSKFLINIKLASKGYELWLLTMFEQALLRAFTIVIQHGIEHESVMPLALATFC
jgi:hypothetical protein